MFSHNKTSLFFFFLAPDFKNYSILMLGRLLGGVSTSLLFSVFEAWLIRSHADAELPKQCLSKSFSWAAYGNSVVAITAGLIANKIAHAGPMTPVTDLVYKGGYLYPFDLALGALFCCAVGAQFLWGENYGEDDTNQATNEKGRGKWHDGLKNALTTTMRNRDVFICGIISSLFEGSMYIFVFMWTPLLKSFLDPKDDGDLPFGLIFACFMVNCMTGSSLFSILVEKYPVEKLGIAIFAVGASAMAIVCFEINSTMSFLGMNLFEITVGMYFPIMGTMKGGIVPEDKRAAIYNLYRIPLNFIVLFSLLTDLTPQFSFALNATMLGMATILQTVLTKRRLEKSPSNEGKEATESLVENAEDISPPV
jgi:MFS transporter, MFS domain-containing protein family, molybdate-anion transporter